MNQGIEKEREVFGGALNDAEWFGSTLEEFFLFHDDTWLVAESDKNIELLY